MTARFRLPEGIDDRAIPFADDVIIPVPSFWVDRFTHRAKQFQIAQVMFFNPFRASSHESTDRSWCSIELVHLVLGAGFPEAASIGVGGHAFKHDCRAAIGQGAINDIAVARDPAHVCGTPEHITVVIIERIFVRHRRVDNVATCRMHDAFGLTC